MSCYHPMVLIKTSDMTDPVQREIAWRLKMDHLGDNRFKSSSTLIVPREVAIREGLTLKDNNAILIPCGHCIGCRLDYSLLWAQRCVHEAESHEYNYFLSLTYDDAHLPKKPNGIPTLIHDEISKFMKALRQKFKNELDFDGIRFFGCGEYGTKGERAINPHYHILLFNCPIPDLQERHPIVVDGKIKWIYQYDDQGNKLLFSKLVADCWKDENGVYKGTAQIGQVTFESAAYVARYCMKKDGSKNDFQMAVNLGIEPQYLRMSRRPGIGYDWYQEHYEQLFLYDNYIFKRGDKAISVKPGRYFDKLVKEKSEQDYYDLKERRHRDFYDHIDCLSFEGIDLVNNNLACELEKERCAKMLKRKV